MLLKELKKQVDFLMEHGHQNDPVLITLSDPSVGGRANSGVLNILSGFDWEHGQIRLEPEKRLLSFEKDRDLALPAIHKVYDLNGRKRNLFKCPKCENHLQKTFHYCPKCGQKIICS